MRDAVDNPFSPGSDTVPEIWAGRTAQLSDWRDILRPRLHRGLPERGRTILGEPGLGKSSLVRRIAQDAAAGGDWVTPQLRIPSGADPLKLLAAALLVLADAAGLATAREKRLAGVLERVQAVAASGISLTLRGREGPEPHTALTELLVEVGRAAIAQDVVALIHLDEVQNIVDESALSQLLIALGDAITHEVVVELPGGVRVTRFLPLAVYLTGLPDFEDRAGAQKGATFARRFKTTVLTAIDDDDIVAALQDFVLPGWDVPDERGGTTRIRMESDAVAVVVELCRGEPFLFQLAGESAWYAGTGTTITRQQVLAGWRGAQREAAAHVERILGRLPPRELAFLEAMASMPARDRTLTRIARAIGLSKPTEAGTTAQRLDTVRGIIDRGTLYRFRHRAIEAYLTSEWPRAE
ncbi:AAA family ATPase [Rathayibacter caricis DSM 15933]|uniref:AAA family ATPase n=1 Tax=Rathayibacter caricis DSM 15933 TaxID=1328867 RepID=A0A2T4USH1_9MICO|nr:AAA family ATPase [Rathayibacter caricis]PTL72479.1 AAA family ATPase [Rathayibacter caricis DSM 15933]